MVTELGRDIIESDNDTLEEALTLTDENDVLTRMESVRVTKEAEEDVPEELDIDLEDPEVDRAALKIQASFRGSLARKEVQAMKEVQAEKEIQAKKEIQAEKEVQPKKEVQAVKEVHALKEAAVSCEESDSVEDDIEIDWSDSSLEVMATQVQAGYRGMKVREEVRQQDELERRASALKSKQIENRLGIDLKDPSIVHAVTRIQAGFRGALARKTMKKDGDKPPDIIVEETTEDVSESEYTYEYEDENDESESLQDRPASPLTAIGNNGEEFSIAGFKASAIITTWLQRRRRLRTMTEADKDIVATRIQAGYKGMITREEHKREDGEKVVLNGRRAKSSPFRMAGKIAVLATRRRVKRYPLSIR